MKKLIIGSTALKHWFPEDYPREPKDLDIVVESTEGFDKQPGIEYLLNPVILKYQDSGYIDPSLLLTLKLSHMFWDNNWEKHMYDIQFLVSKGYKHNDKIFKELFLYWKETLPKVRRTNTNMSAKEFFTNAINKNPDEHDKLHKIINPVPMYTKLLMDGYEVKFDKSKWDALSWEDKAETVREETYVMAYERYKNLYYKKGFEIQLKENIMKHFSKYISKFAILNYKELVTPKYNYINKINEGRD